MPRNRLPYRRASEVWLDGGQQGLPDLYVRSLPRVELALTAFLRSSASSFVSATAIQSRQVLGALLDPRARPSPQRNLRVGRDLRVEVDARSLLLHALALARRGVAVIRVEGWRGTP